MPQPRQPPSFPTPGVCRACGQRCFDLSSTIATPLSGTHHSGISTPTSESQYSHLDLLEQVFSTCAASRPLGRSVAQARELASTLGLGEPGAYPGLRWGVAPHTVNDLGPKKIQLPDKHVHSGKFNWVGREKIEMPKYLWDNIDFKTVKAAPQLLRKYCAVSWTWGRYQKKCVDGQPEWRENTKGLQWRVPKLPLVKSQFFGRRVDRLTHLKHLLSSIKTFRYFWVDVLCINQNGDDDAEAAKKIEITKQAQIFRNATASIAFLWGLDERDKHDLSRALGALGGLLASCISFRPGHPFIGVSSVGGDCSIPHRSEWDSLFTRLDDKWFTSLWALQEMILAPATIWMTQDGGITTVNNHSVTTRFFASAVRLLQQMLSVRNRQWLLEEEWYLRRHTINEAHYSKLRKTLNDMEHRRRMLLQEERRRQNEQSDETALCLEISTDPRIPSILKHWQADQPLQDEIDKWIKWSFGKAGIDVCLGANRTAILIAGSNREVVDDQSKEFALLAALKIGYDKELLPEEFQDFLECDERHFSHKLLNVVLREEGPRMFDVLHESFSSHLLDISEYELVPANFPYLEIMVPDKPRVQRRDSDDDGDWIKITEKIKPLQHQAKYHQNGRDKYVAIPRQKDRILTDMSPWRAAYTNNIDSSHEGSASLLPEDISDWHLHPSGKVHIPPSARIQDISTTSNGAKIKLRLNGGEAEYDIFGASDFKHIWRTQKWLYEKLGKPKFLFLPLYIPRDPGGRIKKSREAYYRTVRHEENIGIVLVGRAHLRKEQSHTIWYKLGTYTGTGPLTSLGWKDGIIVTSPHEEVRMSAAQLRRECQRVTGVATLFKQTSSDMAAMVEEETFDGLHLSELPKLQSRESFGSTQTANEGYRSHFVRYFGWLFGGATF